MSEAYHTRITQAIVLVGGKASRLRAANVSVPLSKAFLIIASKPTLYWALHCLHTAGIRRLVLVGDKVVHLHEAEVIIRSHHSRFIRVDYVRDEGNGVHGIPYELRYLLEDMYVFDCGHSISKPTHYRKLMSTKASHKSCRVVLSGYTPHPKNLRQPVTLFDGRVLISQSNKHCVAHPMVADRQYAASLLHLDFTITKILDYYIESNSVRYVLSDMPVEYDIQEEMAESIPAYNEFIDGIGIIKR